MKRTHFKLVNFKRRTTENNADIVIESCYLPTMVMVGIMWKTATIALVLGMFLD